MVHSQSSLIQHSIQVGIQTVPYLADHRVGAQVILPLATYLDLAWTLGRLQCRPHDPIITGLRVDEPLLLRDNPCTLFIQLTQAVSDEWQATFRSHDPVSGPIHATASFRADGLLAVAPADLTALRARCPEPRLPAQHYAAMEALGIHYGPAFQTLQTIWRTDGAALAWLQLAPALAHEAAMYQVHPTLLDGAIQSVLAARPEEQALKLPAGLDGLVLAARAQTGLWAYSRITETSASGAFSADVSLLDATGQWLGSLTGLRIQPARVVEATPPAARQAEVGALAPASPGAQALRTIWQECLESAEIDLADRFFDLGGDSIIAAQIADKARRAGYALEPQEILEHQTIAALLKLIAARKDLAS